MFLIIQTGDPVPIAQQQFGRFSDWFIQGLGLTATQADVIDVHLGQPLPQAAQAAEIYAGVVITGSAAMVTERDPWLSDTQNWLQQVGKFQLPMLGVCYGHQVLADLLGGQVDYNPKGRNMGLSQFQLTPAGQTDELFRVLSKDSGSTPTLASHLQSVIQLPTSATLMGQCELDPHHAFRAEQNIWGVQFHPEWHRGIMQAYIQARQQDLSREGFDPQQMVAELVDCDLAYGLLSRFAALAQAQHAATRCA